MRALSIQTKRFDRYKEVIDELLARRPRLPLLLHQGGARADARRARLARGEKPRYDGRWRDRTDTRPGVDPVVRFKNPLDGEVVVDDVVHGRVVFQNTELDDLIIARSDGSPTYNFCVVVDDMDMRITHVIRGDDHLNNTPRQMNMLLALGHPPPVYAHLPMILGPDGTKLSKRHGAVSVLQYRDEGFLPEAVLNYLVRLGWSHGDQEVFSIEEMVRLFDIARCEQIGLGLRCRKAHVAQSAAHDARSGGARRAAAALASESARHRARMTTASWSKSCLRSASARKTVQEMAREQPVFLPAARCLRREGGAQARDRRRVAAAGRSDQLRPGCRGLVRARPSIELIAGIAVAKGSRSANWRNPSAWRYAVERYPRRSMPPWPFWARTESLARLRRARAVWGA